MTGLVHDVVICLAFMVATVVVSLASYWAMRQVVVRFFEDRREELLGSVAFRVGSLYALILALVFAQAMQINRDIRAGLVAEAAAITDLFYDFGLYDDDDGPEMRVLLAQYARAVVDDDWPSLAQTRRNANESFRKWEVVNQHVLDLVPQSPREEVVRGHMLDRLHRIAELTQARIDAATQSISPLFWLAAVAGLVFISAPYGAVAPRPVDLTLIVIVSAFIGLILFVIFSLSDPFSRTGALAPTPYLNLLDSEIGAWVDGPPE